MSAPQGFVGIDVAQAQLDVALRPTEDGWHVNHDASGIAGRVERLRTVQPTLVVREATGGLAVPVTGALAEAGRPGVVVNPRHARDVATATGRLAKTASLEARGLAPCAAAGRPPPRPRPEAQAPALRAWLTRRRQWVQRLTAERRRRQTAPQQIRAAIQAHLTGLTRRLACTAEGVAAAIDSSPRWRATDEMLQRPPGVGPILARTLVAEVPEVGVLNRQEIAALMGVAPLTRESGTVRGKRAVRSMNTLAAGRHHPVLKAFSARLRAVGKAPKVALTACRRKLLTIRNARLKHRTPWHENYATHS